MSALAKPLIRPTAAGSSGEDVNIEYVTNIATVDIPALNSAAAKYLIVFTFVNNIVPQVEWTYTSSASRNTSLGNIRTLAVNSIA
jgi:hypothetical protein